MKALVIKRALAALSTRIKYLLLTVVFIGFCSSIFEVILIAVVSSSASIWTSQKPDYESIDRAVQIIETYWGLEKTSSFLIVFGLVWLFCVFMRFASSYLIHSFARDVERFLSQCLLRTTIVKPYEILAAQNSQDLVRELTTEVSYVVSYFYLSIAQLSVNIVVIAGVLIVTGATLSIATLLSFFLVVTVFLIGFRVISRTVKGFGDTRKQSNADRFKTLDRYFQNLLAFKFEKAEANLFEKLRLYVESLTGAVFGINIVSLYPRLLLDVCFGFGIVILAFYVSYSSGHSVDFFVSVLGVSLAIILRTLPLVQQSFKCIVNLKFSLSSVSSLLKSIENLESFTPKEKSIRKKEYFNSLVVKDIIIGRKDAQLSKPISFDLFRSEWLCVTGNSGCGKSTLLMSLNGLLPRLDGGVTLNGQALQSNESVNDFVRVSYVSQDTAVFEGTIEDNVCGLSDLTLRGSDHGETYQKLFFALGLNSWLGNDAFKALSENVYQNGRSLSGGQRQRLGMLRALVTEPELLILDEAMNAIDELGETQLLKNIKAMFPELAVISVSHRQNAFPLYDRVFNLNDYRDSIF